MANTTRPGLRALIAVSRTDPRELDAAALGFRLAPRINAAGRLRRADAGLELLLTARPRPGPRRSPPSSTRVNVERRAVEQRILWEAEAQVAELGERSAYVLAGRGLASRAWSGSSPAGSSSAITVPALLIATRRSRARRRARGGASPASICSAALDACAAHLGATAATAPPPGCRSPPSRDRRPCARDFEAHADGGADARSSSWPTERVDAVVCGSELGLELAEELGAAGAVRDGQPARPAARLRAPGSATCARWGRAGTSASRSAPAARGRARWRSAATAGCPAGRTAPLDATFSLERNVWNGAVEPRLVLRHAHPCTPRPILVRGEADGYLAGVWRELERELAVNPRARRRAPPRRFDRRRGPDGPRRARAQPAGAAAGADRRRRSGCSPLRRRPAAAGRAEPSVPAASSSPPGARSTTIRRWPRPLVHVVALDPPLTRPSSERGCAAGAGFAHLAWGEPELRFAQQMYAYEHDLRAPLTTVFRGCASGGRWPGRS